jgi:hypothetical protein
MISKGYGAVAWGVHVLGRILGRIIAYGLTRGIATAPINVRCPKSYAHITRFRAEAGEVPN